MSEYAEASELGKPFIRLVSVALYSQQRFTQSFLSIKSIESNVMQEKEYENKWQYIMHTENMQAKFIQWYLTVCAATFVFLYANKNIDPAPLLIDRRLALTVLSLYSVLTCLRLLAQKKNYDTYTARVRELEGNISGNYNTRKKIFSVFKLQYYVICIVGGLVVSTLLSEFYDSFTCSIIVGFSYSIFFVYLSFTKLIGS